MSAEARNKMSKQATERNANTHFTKGVGGYREDIGHYVRSSWEANIGRVLKELGCEYQFEPDTFPLRKTDELIIHYIPDFKVGDWYIEVKGWWNEKALLTKKLMAEQYPEIQIFYLGEDEYNQIQHIYKEKINGWETRRASKR